MTSVVIAKPEEILGSPSDFNERETEAPLSPIVYFALDKTGEFIFYEDYVTKLVEENERHKEYLCKDYENFKPSGTK